MSKKEIKRFKGRWKKHFTWVAKKKKNEALKRYDPLSSSIVNYKQPRSRIEEINNTGAVESLNETLDKVDLNANFEVDN